jgi:hypothetical protein
MKFELVIHKNNNSVYPFVVHVFSSKISLPS